MPGPTASTRTDRILVRDGRRHHRPRYSRAEFRLGLLVLAVLVAIVGWVAWRGGRPDPALFAAPEATLAAAGTGRQVVERDAAPTTAPAGTGGAASPSAAPAADRGPLPDGLAAPGWSETGLSTFDPSDLYVKINGREDYYKSFGFRRLHFLTLVSDEDPALVVDIEAFDLGEPANALGAYAGERPEGVAPEVGERGVAHLDRNALFLARGPWYVRAIGVDESAATRAQLERIRASLEAAIPGEPLPWAWGLFAGTLGIDPGRVRYDAENAFSFGFARDVWSAQLEDESEPFVVAAGDPAAAADLAGRFLAGFLEYGEPAGEEAGVAWTVDRYIATVSGAKAVGPWTVGVRGAPDRATAAVLVSELEAAVRDLPIPDPGGSEP